MKIAIVKLSALGDIVNAMVVLQFIKKNNPKIKIDWVVEKAYKELLSNNPNVNKVHTVNFKLAKQKKSLPIFFKEIKKIRQFGKFDIVIDMQGLIKSAFVSRMISSEVTVGFHRSSSRESISSIFYSHKFKMDYKENIICRNLSLVANSLNFTFKGNEIQNKDPFLYPSKKYIPSSFSKSMKNIVLIPGASHPCKCYPVEGYIKVIKKIDANFIIIWGSDSEKLTAKKIKKLYPSVNISKKLSLDELISLIKQSDLIIGSDTGPSHIAWGLNVPSVILFGCTPGYRNTYETKLNKIIIL
ncbi:MAG: lipopolysaccharide heptosyltransferase I, partial [Alphaproteobacteria bacterium]|nr:lipopolysaccharide heptosyltransferase I [Alphaproteobacteria bacterium]